MLRRIWEWWQLRRLERDRAFLLRNRDDPRAGALLPLVEQRIVHLRMGRIRRMLGKS